jgi:type I restriction enzyme S subunit
LEEFSLPVPPSGAEQRKIAECLSSLDELIAAQSRKVDTLKAHKKGLMQQLFPREGEPVPRLRFPEFRDAGAWVIRRLGDFADIFASGDLDSRTFSKTNSELYRFPVYSNAVEKEGLYGFSSIARQSKNSVTITARGNLGCAFLRTTAFVAIGRLIVVSNFESAADSFFLKEAWNHLADIPAEVTSIPQLTAVAARAAKLPFPVVAEQQRIGDLLRGLDSLIAAEFCKLQAVKSHKNGLMQQLFPLLEVIKS